MKEGLNTLSDEALLRTVGERLAALRLARNLTQQQVANQAGLGLRTVQRLELGAAATQLSGFLRVCRILGVAENLDSFLPPPTPSPLAQLEAKGRARQRATGSKKKAPGATKKWTWGESQ